jgi:hypothetical protein
MKGLKGLLGLVFVGILLKLNMLENLVGIWRRLKIFGTSMWICCSGKSPENLKRSLLKLLVHVFSISITNISTNWVLTLQNLFIVGIPTLVDQDNPHREEIQSELIC